MTRPETPDQDHIDQEDDGEHVKRTLRTLDPTATGRCQDFGLESSHRVLDCPPPPKAESVHADSQALVITVAPKRRPLGPAGPRAAKRPRARSSNQMATRVTSPQMWPDCTCRPIPPPSGGSSLPAAAPPD